MELSTAIGLINKGFANTRSAQVWADLGAGGGLFTNALASLLHKDSVIYAVDKDISAVNTIALTAADVILKKVHLDFSNLNKLNLEPLDGVLMANSLHYVKDKEIFLQRLNENLKPSGRIILVEYDTRSPNPWVPYPLAYTLLQEIAKRNGFNTPQKLGDAPSQFRQGNLYAALLTRQGV